MSSQGEIKSDLTAREEEVLAQLARGRLYKEIADELRISVSAVHKHQHNLYRKLRIGDRTEATVKWMSITIHGSAIGRI